MNEFERVELTHDEVDDFVNATKVVYGTLCDEGQLRDINPEVFMQMVIHFLLERMIGITSKEFTVQAAETILENIKNGKPYFMLSGD